MTGRRLAWVAIAACLGLAGYLAVTRRREPAPPPPDVAEDVTAPPPPAAPIVQPPPVAAPVDPPAQAPNDTSPAPLTPTGRARALDAIVKNDQTRQIFVRLQALGLSPEQRDRVVLILGAAALRPPAQSPTLLALRADGNSRLLSPEEGQRIAAEKTRLTQEAVRSLRPALASVLTPSQLAAATLETPEAKR